MGQRALAGSVSAVYTLGTGYEQLVEDRSKCTVVGDPQSNILGMHKNGWFNRPSLLKHQLDG